MPYNNPIQSLTLQAPTIIRLMTRRPIPWRLKRQLKTGGWFHGRRIDTEADIKELALHGFRSEAIDIAAPIMEEFGDVHFKNTCIQNCDWNHEETLLQTITKIIGPYCPFGNYIHGIGKDFVVNTDGSFFEIDFSDYEPNDPGLIEDIKSLIASDPPHPLAPQSKSKTNEERFCRIRKIGDDLIAALHWMAFQTGETNKFPVDIARFPYRETASADYCVEPESEIQIFPSSESMQ